MFVVHYLCIAQCWRFSWWLCSLIGSLAGSLYLRPILKDCSFVLTDQKRDKNPSEPMWGTKRHKAAWYRQGSALQNTKLSFWVCQQYRFQSSVSNVIWLWHTLLHLWASEGNVSIHDFCDVSYWFVIVFDIVGHV